MNKKLLLLVVILCPMANLCYTCCNCPETEPSKTYTHKSITVCNLDNSDEYPVKSDASQFNKNAYGIRIYLNREETVAVQTSANPFINEAHAVCCFCDPAYAYAALDSITTIKITTLHDFDLQNAAGADISGYFKNARSFLSISDYIKRMAFSYAGDSPLQQEIAIDLLLMSAPSIAGLQQFNIQIILSDGRILQQLTKEVSLI